MTQAKRVHSTPLTDTSLSRRSILGAVAVASAGAIAVRPIAVQGATIPDPVFGVIEAHRKAVVDHIAAISEQLRFEQIGDPEADHAAEKPCDAANDFFVVLVAAVPTTMHGLIAKVTYLNEIARRGDAWMFEGDSELVASLIESLAETLNRTAAVI